MSGTVNISRDIWDDTAFKAQPFTEREAFMWLVMEASWKPREKRVGSVVVSLDRGQLATSLRFMGEAWDWPKSTVDRFLKRLEKRDMIGTADGTGVTVITIRKYNEYQGNAKQSGTGENEKAGQQRDSSGTNEKKGLIPDNTHSEGKPSDGEAVDFTKEVFDRGVAFLGRYGVPEGRARPLIGKWRKEAGDAETFNALRDAHREGVTEPVAWITARLGRKGGNLDLDQAFKDLRSIAQ